jgi:acyl-coenzyme A thioesterase 13
MTVPDSFTRYARSSQYLDLIGPLYERRGEPSTVGLAIGERHTNSRGLLHAGVLVTIADTVMGHTAERVSGGSRVVTASLTTNFVGTAHVGEWLEGEATVQRCGRRLAFASCEFHVGDRLILGATGVFAVTAGAER